MREFLGSFFIVSDLITAQIDKTTSVPGIIVYTGKETIFEKFSIPILILIKYSPVINARITPKEINQTDKIPFCLWS